jgi:uncharacterized protein (DUF2225 family)
MRKTILAVFLTLATGVAATATTWAPEEFTCPIDNEKNTFQVVMSYGSYIYAWPSKYQWLFWPRTDSPTFYLCKKCHYAAYMWDFDKIPKERIPAVRKALEGVKVSKSFSDYQQVPVNERLDIMAKVYAVLEKDDLWWEEFYRLRGYHYHAAGMADKAAGARRASLTAIGKELAKPESNTPRKLLLYISGAMKHFLNDDAGALADLKKALETKYEEKGKDPKEIDSAEKGLNARIEDYMARIRSDEKPRDGEY